MTEGPMIGRKRQTESPGKGMATMSGRGRVKYFQ